MIVKLDFVSSKRYRDFYNKAFKSNLTLRGNFTVKMSCNEDYTFIKYF